MLTTIVHTNKIFIFQYVHFLFILLYQIDIGNALFKLITQFSIGVKIVYEIREKGEGGYKLFQKEGGVNKIRRGVNLEKLWKAPMKKVSYLATRHNICAIVTLSTYVREPQSHFIECFLGISWIYSIYPS